MDQHVYARLIFFYYSLHNAYIISKYSFLADDTKRWRSELNNLAKKVGILTSEEADSDLTLQNSTGQARKQNDQIKIDSLEIKNVKSLEFQRANTMVNMSVNTNKPNAGITRKKLVQDEIGLAKEERIKTGRFNEPRGSALGTRKSTSSRLRTSLNLNPNKSKFILCTEESEREMWVRILVYFAYYVNSLMNI